MTVHDLRQGALAAVVIALTLAVVAWVALSLGLAEGQAAEVTDRYLPHGHRDERVVIVALDARFLDRAEHDPIGAYLQLTELAGAERARSLVIDPQVLTVADEQRGTAAPEQTFEAALVAFYDVAQAVVHPLPAGRLSAPRPGSRIPVLDRAVPNSSVAEAASATGFGLLVANTPDTNARTVPLVAELLESDRAPSGRIVPAQTVVAYLRADNLAARVSERRGGLDVGGRFVPTEDEQRLRVAYTAALLPGGAGIISATDLIDGKIEARRLAGKTTFVGITDPRYAELVATPVGVLPTVFAQANTTNTLLTRQFLVPQSDGTTVLTVGILAFLVALAVLVLPIWLGPLAPLVMGVAYWLYAANRFDHGRVTNALYALTAAAIAFVAALSWKGASEVLGRRRVSQMFSRYVPQRVAEQLLASGAAEAAASGQRLEVAVLFCDLRGFTVIAAELEPTQVRELLDHYYECVSALVLERGGTVMQFVGDEVFAVFGAPLAQPDAAPVGLDCARAIVAARAELAATLTAEGLPAIAYGIGFHVGEVVAAHVGSTTRRQYAVVGDTVNVGSRLCGQAGAGEIVLSDEARRAAGGPTDAERLGVLTLKGVRREVTGYRITPESDVAAPAATLAPERP